ncbi:MAG: hypothetical protein IID44_21235 [Planctomycetes bacterium]|nr:hypothetical protein [Planctomycetota bacterium]
MDDKKSKLPVGCWWLIGVVVVVVLIIGYMLYRGVTSSIEAEYTLQADRLVLQVLTQHLKENSGKWPSSWTELQSTVPEAEYSMWKWPNDIDEIKERIHVDFTLQTEDVARMDVDSFTAVRQSYPNYGPNESFIERLIWTARESVGQREENEEEREKK